jgi:hypothetical protein
MNMDDQIGGARELLQERLPGLLHKAGLRSQSAEKGTAIVIADLKRYVERALLAGETPLPASGTELAHDVGVSRSQFVEQMQNWSESMVRAGTMFGKELAELTGHARSTFCLFEETDSPIGRDVHAPGMFEQAGEKLQRVWGPMLVGPDMQNLLRIDPPASDQLEDDEFTQQLCGTLDAIGDCTRRLESPTTRRIQASSPPERIAPSDANGRAWLTTALIPRLAAGSVRVGGTRTILTANVAQVRAMLEANERAAEQEETRHLDNGFRRAVIEIEEQPYLDGRDLEWIDDGMLRKYLGWMLGWVPLDLKFRTTGLEVVIDHRDEREAVLHRIVKEDAPELATMVSPHASFALLGFDLRPGAIELPEGPHLADPLLGVEMIASRVPAHACAISFGREHAPCLARTTTEDGRAFMRACRAIQRSALSFIAAGYTTRG